ncbi:ComEC/Rec2 family competence protein [Flavobacterium cerinum]|uniref:ComEC family competence protein n=1 Tax=Flavobacterium cerinum TaxID=2502784 RepID=A0A444HF92_9FLAO|nr:ComEC/Rec2 family competence protein [Flavobacterium cerinum]RWX03658.1 ComEC family competence protein [Flavobacterium cerinum]
MTVLKYPIILITVIFTLGILAGSHFSLSLTFLCILNFTTFGALMISFWYAKKSFLQKPYFTISVLFFSLFIGMLIQALHYTPNQKLHYSHKLTDETPLIKGVISERLKPNLYQEKYCFEVTFVNQQPATGKILLTVSKDSISKQLNPGDSFIIADTPQPIQKKTNPYQFDYAGYMQKQDIFHQLRLKDNYVRTETLKNFDYYIGQLRNKLTQSFSIHNYSPEVQQTLNALLLGQRQDMDNVTANNYKNAGVLHILAISGLHFAVLFYILTFLFRPLNRLKNHGQLIQLILVLSILWGFAFITGLSASVVRSVVMFSFIGIGQYLNRNANIYNSLAISMLVLLSVKPGFLFDAGFQLSYLAVLSIVWFEPFYKKIKISRYKAVNYFGDTVLISLAAQLGVLPLSLYYFNQFPLLFLLANVVVIPLSNIILVAGLGVLILNFLWIDAALYIGKVLETLVQIMNGFIAWIASFDRFIFKDIPFTLSLSVSLYIVLILTAFWIYKRNYTRTVAVLCSFFLFQCILAFTVWNNKNKDELIVFHNQKHTLITLKNNNEISIISTDSLAKESSSITAYNKGNFNQSLKLRPLQNMIYFKGKKILLLDKDALYKQNIKPDILILTNSSKVNLARAIHQLNPKLVIADGNNYKMHIKQWAATCQNAKIPFHATAEKGHYIFK